MQGLALVLLAVAPVALQLFTRVSADIQPAPPGSIDLVPAHGDFLLQLNVSMCKLKPTGVGAGVRMGKSTIEAVFDATSTTMGSASTYASFSLDPSSGTIELLRYRHGNRTVASLGWTCLPCLCCCTQQHDAVYVRSSGVSQ